MRNAAIRNGSVAVETALMLIVLFAIWLIASDMYRIGIERTRLEGTATNMAINASVQSELTKPGLDILAEIAMQGHEGQQQIIILNVMRSGRVNWMLSRGDATDLCEAEVEDKLYTGTLPEDPTAEEVYDPDEPEDPSKASFVIVRACRSTEDIKSYGGIIIPTVIQVDSVYRATAREITIDEDLEEENEISEDSE